MVWHTETGGWQEHTLFPNGSVLMVGFFYYIFLFLFLLKIPLYVQNLPKNVAAAGNRKDKDTHTLTSSTTSSEVQSSTTLERSDLKNAYPVKCVSHVRAAQGGGKKKRVSSDDDENSEDEEYSEEEESDDDFESEEDKDFKDKKGNGGKW